MCDVCAADPAPISVPDCPRCGVVAPFVCNCRSLPPEIDRLRSVYPFHGWVRAAIHRLKYNGERARAPMLAHQFTRIGEQFESVDAIVPVPMHPERQSLRGFNQSELLAEYVSGRFGIPVLRVLERVEDRGSQVGRNSQERWLAVDGVFRCLDAAAVSNRRLIVLDDVITTGATVSSCARELIRAGASTVTGVSIARG